MDPRVYASKNQLWLASVSPTQALVIKLQLVLQVMYRSICSLLSNVLHVTAPSSNRSTKADSLEKTLPPNCCQKAAGSMLKPSTVAQPQQTDTYRATGGETRMFRGCLEGRVTPPVCLMDLLIYFNPLLRFLTCNFNVPVSPVGQ